MVEVSSIGAGCRSIVCIGASAGGLEAIERFFQSCPDNLDVAYVLIQHLSSHYKSMMDDLVNRYTSMPVQMIKEGVAPQANSVYLIEAGTSVKLKNGVFAVDKKQDGELSLPIDIFLQSLTDAHLTKVIAVVLSGTGSDGSRGAISVNARGGFVIAQDPEDADFNGMPKSVIETGIVDDVEPAEKIPLIIEKYLRAPVRLISPDKTVSESDPEHSVSDAIAAILGKLKREHGLDFTRYKEATVLRRIERRMQVKHLSRFSQYAQLVETDPVESVVLRKELLIPVTSFFRDQQVFELARKTAVRDLIRQASNGEEIRVWIAGCSTGEEAYSLMILMLEELSMQGKKCSTKFFATDVNPDVIDFASRGIYPESISTEIPAEYLKTYFSRREESFIVSSKLRQQIVFAVHNLLADAPFTKMHMVSCRNTLIYLQSEAQKSAMQKLQYALSEGGYLLLGKSENLCVHEDYFDVVDRKLKLFRCIKATPATVSPVELRIRRSLEKPVRRQAESLGDLNHLMEKECETILNNHFRPLSLLLNSKHEVIHIYGADTRLLRFKPGNISYLLGNLLPDELVPASLALLYRLGKENEFITSGVVEVAVDERETVNVNLCGWRIDKENIQPHFVLSFCLENVEKRNSLIGHNAIDNAHVERIQQLELELRATRESLQSTIEELETTNEELQATNEELMASNEELQSSNEELQSVNEELNTVNAEYHEKMSILNRMNADLEAMSLSTGIATVFVDDNQNLTRFTADATTIFKIRAQDLGRPLNEIVHFLDYDQLYDDLKLTIMTGRTKEAEVLGKDGNHYLVRIVSYKLSSLERFGAAISLVESKNIAVFRKVLDSLSEHIAVLDSEGQILLVNGAWNRFANQNASGKSLPSLGVGANYLAACSADPSANEVVTGIRELLNGDREHFSLKYPCHSSTEKRWFIMDARAIKHPFYSVVVSHFNVTQWEEA